MRPGGDDPIKYFIIWINRLLFAFLTLEDTRVKVIVKGKLLETSRSCRVSYTPAKQGTQPPQLGHRAVADQETGF